MKELSVRIKAVLRRYQSIDNKTDSETVAFDNIKISLSKYELKIKGIRALIGFLKSDIYFVISISLMTDMYDM